MERRPRTSPTKSINTFLGGQIANLKSQLKRPKSRSPMPSTCTSCFKSILGIFIRRLQPNLWTYYQPRRIHQFQIDGQSQSTIARPDYHHDFKFAHLVEGSGLDVSIFVPFRDKAVALLCDVLWSRSRATEVIGFGARIGSRWWWTRKSDTRSRQKEKNHLKVSLSLA